MELYFCDLCQEAVPNDDVTRGLASVKGGHVVCKTCNASMGASPVASASGSGGSEPSGSQPSKAEPPSKRPDEKWPPAPRPAKRGSLVSPGVAAALGVASIALTLFAVIALLVRLETVARDWRADFAATGDKLERIEKQQLGTRGYMVAEVGRVSEEVLHGELARVETMERQLGEIREALLGREGRSGAETEESRAESRTQLLTVGDGLERVGELEDQVLFLQSRVFELIEGQAIAPRAPAPNAERPLPVPTTLGELVARLDDPDPVERVGALYALAKVSDTGVVAHVVPLLEDRDKYIRALAARTLERLDARSSVQSLLALLEDADAEVREAAISALRAITAQQFLFDPRGSLGERGAAVTRWRAWWSQHWKTFLYSEE